MLLEKENWVFFMKLLTKDKRKFREWCCLRAHCCENSPTKGKFLKLNFFTTISQMNWILLCVCFKLFTAQNVSRCCLLSIRVPRELKISFKAENFIFSLSSDNRKGGKIELTFARTVKLMEPKKCDYRPDEIFKIPRSFSHRGEN